MFTRQDTNDHTNIISHAECMIEKSMTKNNLRLANRMENLPILGLIEVNTELRRP